MPLHCRRRELLVLGAALAAAGRAPAQRTAAPPALLVVEDQGRRLALVDAQRLERLREWRAGGTVLGPPQFAPDGRHAFLALADGTLARHDLLAGVEAARVPAGADPRGLALSADGHWLLAAHGSALTLFDRGLQAVRRYPAASLDGKTASPVAAVLHARQRRSFVVGFERLPELWEISYDRAAAPIFDGLVHDYRMAEAIAAPGFLGVRRTPLEAPFAARAVDAAGRSILGAGAAALDVVNLDVRRRIASLPGLATAPALLAAFEQRSRPRLAAAGADGTVHIVDAVQWREAGTLPGAGEPVFLHTHPRSAHLWLGTLAGGRARLTAIDKNTLEPAGELAVAERLLGPVAFDGEGRRLWASVRGSEDALLVVGERERGIVARLPAGASPAAWAMG